MNDVSDRPALKLDLGCGTRKKEGFLGVDTRNFHGVDVVADLRAPWPWTDWSVGEVHCSHFLEHLEAMERVHFFNELYRVMIPGRRARIVTPHWANARAYGDPTHKWPPVCEFTYFYLRKTWRMVEAPHTDFYKCDFDFTIEYTVKEELHRRPEGERTFAIGNYRDAIQDLIVVLTKL